VLSITNSRSLLNIFPNNWIFKKENTMKKWILYPFIFLFAFPVLSQETEYKVPIQDFLKMNSVSNFQISPDGLWITYTYGVRKEWDGSRNYAIWLLTVDGAQQRKLTNSEKSDWSPLWSPDGSKIAFASNRSGQVQVHVIAINGGEARQVTFASGGVGRFAWINNTRIAYTADEPRDSSLTAAEKRAGGGYVVGTRANTSALWTQSVVHKTDTKKITDGRYYIREMTPASDGKHFVLVTAEDSDLYTQITDARIVVIDQEGNVQFTFKDGKDFSNPCFSPDNRKIAFIGTTVGFSARNALFVGDLRKQSTHNVTDAFDPTILDVHWLDNQTLSYVLPI
jgi:Tol biopolymer transport system component